LRLEALTISYNCYPRLDDIVDTLRLLSQDHLATQAKLLRIARSDFDVTANIPRHEHLVVGFYLLAGNLYPLQGKLPLVLSEAHGVTAVFQANIEQGLPMALGQAPLDMLSERCDVLFGGVGKERLEADVRLVVIGEAELVEDAQLIVVFEDGGGLAWRSAQRLLFLDVVGEFAERLVCTLA